MEVLSAERLDEIVTNENEGAGWPSALNAGLGVSPGEEQDGNV